jgi:hypothetical protein
MSVGPKLGKMGPTYAEYQTPSVYVNITPATILISSLTFLVLGPIDLTNGRAGMVYTLTSTLRGT